MTLSIKTAHDSGLSFGRSELLHIDDDHAWFLCKCEATFKKLKYKPYTDAMKDLVCAKCRVADRVGPYQAERQIYRRVFDDARTRSLAFDISIEDFAEMIHQPCHYCGSIDMNSSQVSLTKPSGESFKTGYKYNGIDRMDNSLGYVYGNMVPCCFICNRAKRDMGYEDFMNWINNIVSGGMR